MLVGDVAALGEEDVDGVEGLSVWLTDPLGGCEETVLEGASE